MKTNNIITATCPKCLGIGEIYNGKTMKKCDICKTTGKVNEIVSHAFINELLYDE
jgi:DnaJ-class molecular chaperone